MVKIPLISQYQITEEKYTNNEYEDFCEKDIENCLPVESVPNAILKTDREKIASIRPSKKMKTSYEVERNIPLLVKDILKLQIIDTDKERFSVFSRCKRHFSAYGIPFETVTVYGNWFQRTIDDGTGSIQVTDCNKQDIRKINNLRIDLDNRIQTAKAFNEIEINSCLSRLLEHTESEITNKNLKNGIRVSVIGIPFKYKDSPVRLIAFEINIVNDQNSDKELFFKRELIRYYTTHYAGCKIDGSKKQ